jgi:CDP-diglyceride synthetase
MLNLNYVCWIYIYIYIYIYILQPQNEMFKHSRTEIFHFNLKIKTPNKIYLITLLQTMNWMDFNDFNDWNAVALSCWFEGTNLQIRTKNIIHCSKLVRLPDFIKSTKAPRGDLRLTAWLWLYRVTWGFIGNSNGTYAMI